MDHQVFLLDFLLLWFYLEVAIHLVQDYQMVVMWVLAEDFSVPA